MRLPSLRFHAQLSILSLLILFSLCGCAEQELEAFRRSPLHTATIKDLPSSDALSIRVNIARKDTWPIAHRAAMLYFSYSNNRMHWPVFLLLPDETERAEHEWLFLLSEQETTLVDPATVANRLTERQLRGIRWSLKRLDPTSIVAYRVNRRPTYSALQAATEFLYNEGNRRNWPLGGKPRYAIFANPRVTPFFMQSFEVQIPILDSSPPPQ